MPARVVNPAPPAGLAGIATLDKTIHEPARFLILGCLSVVAQADFVFLKRQTGFSDGNLSSHLRKLAEEGYICVEKMFVHNTPRTVLAITELGREKLDLYLQTMQAVMKSLGK